MAIASFSPASFSPSHSAAIAGDPTVLERIRDSHIHLALWHRPRPASLAWIDLLAWNRIEDLDFRTAVGTLDADVSDGLTHAGYPRGGRGLALRDEIVSLARRFAAILRCSRVKIRLEAIDNDACRKFHSDAVTARLLATLSGAGTQWIEADEPDPIHQLATGDVAIFKGRRWAESPAILHRSPPIGARGAMRLLLVVDSADDHAMMAGPAVTGPASPLI